MGMPRTRRSFAVLLLALSGLCATGATSDAAQRRTAMTPAALLVALNDVRAQQGLSPVTLDPTLSTAARAHSRDMLGHGYFLHESGPGGEPFSDRLARYVTHPARLGEILAWGTGSQGTPAGVVANWLRSPPHRAVIMSPTFHEVGIGLGFGRFQGVAGAAVWTVDFSD
jgi:uncharacterized protein YkwD